MMNTYRGLVKELSSFLEQQLVSDLRCVISLSTHPSLKRQLLHRLLI